MKRLPLAPQEAVALQQELRDKVRLVPLRRSVSLIGGCDVSMDRFAPEGFGGFVTLSYPELYPRAQSVAKEEIPFPYVPGLLSFREIPMLLKAWDGLKQKPDVVVVDGVGIAHPRRIGIATHLGLLLKVPTIGCAKSVLTGYCDEPGPEPGDFSYLRDPRTEEILGAALRTKRGVKPVFVSPGHLITLEDSLKIIKKCVLRHRLPEPTRLAHAAVNERRLRSAR